MESRILALSLLFLAVIVSGCGGNGTTQSTGGQAISITGPEITPTEIFSGGEVRVRLGMKNVGHLPATINVDDPATQGNNGGNVLVNYCSDIFSLEDFGGRSSREPGVETEYTLRPDEELQLDWELSQSTDNVPLNGYRCNLKFQAPFDYSVEAYRQIQVKRSDETGGNPQLSSKSSEGPLKIVIEAIGSTSDSGSPVFLEGDSIEVLIQLVNKKPEQAAYTGLINLENPEINANGVSIDQDSCRVADGDKLDGNTSIRIYEGNSQIIRCDVNYGTLNQPSIMGEVTVNADYTYVKSIGTRTVQVKYSGN